VSADWPPISYGAWSETCDTLHMHTQVLGKLAVELAPPERQLQHAALRLSPRGWETEPLPAPDGSGAFVAALDLHSHEAVIEHSDGRAKAIPLTPNRAVADVTQDILRAVGELAGPVQINPKPQEVAWETPLDEDHDRATYAPDSVSTYFVAATQAALVLTEFRAPFQGRATPVDAWWGTFDLAVLLYSGRPADPPARDFISRNGVNAEVIEVGWWPGDSRYDGAAFYAFAHPAREGFRDGVLSPGAAHWDDDLGEFILDWEDIRNESDPHALALEFARSAFDHACSVSRWDPVLQQSVQGKPPPIT
jgi:uncharacterized protein DUF5996